MLGLAEGQVLTGSEVADQEVDVEPHASQPSDESRHGPFAATAQRSGAVGAAVTDDRLRPVLLDNIGQLRPNLLERLFPRNLLPLAAATFSDPLHRMEQAVGTVH